MSRHSNLMGRVTAFYYLWRLIMEYRNTDMSNAIAEYIHVSKYRDILRFPAFSSHCRTEIPFCLHICSMFDFSFNLFCDTVIPPS